MESLSRVDLGSLVPLPALSTHCGRGSGLAVCPALGLLVTSNNKDNTLSVFHLPSNDAVSDPDGASLPLVCTLGGVPAPLPPCSSTLLATATSLAG